MSGQNRLNIQGGHGVRAHPAEFFLQAALGTRDLVHHLDQVFAPLNLRDGAWQRHHAALQVLKCQRQLLVRLAPGEPAKQGVCLGSGNREAMMSHGGKEVVVGDSLFHARVEQHKRRVHVHAFRRKMGLQAIQACNERKVVWRGRQPG